MIYEWKMDGVVRNYGDALAELVTPPSVYAAWAADTEHMFFPMGSVICNEIMNETIQRRLKPVFVACGWRGEELNPTLVGMSQFVGARGPHTQAELAKHGVDVEVTMDPGYVVPDLLSKASPTGLAIVIRHIKDPSDYNEFTKHEYGADEVISAAINTIDDTIALTHQISGSRFVLAGAMHAAIVAHAYNIPFALLNGPYIDCLPKWYDWFASVNLGEPVFVSNVAEGRKWYNDNVRNRNTDGI